MTKKNLEQPEEVSITWNMGIQITEAWKEFLVILGESKSIKHNS